MTDLEWRILTQALVTEVQRRPGTNCLQGPIHKKIKDDHIICARLPYGFWKKLAEHAAKTVPGFSILRSFYRYDPPDLQVSDDKKVTLIVDGQEYPSFKLTRLKKIILNGKRHLALLIRTEE